MERYRIQSEAAVYFVTYPVVEWLPIFIREATCKIVTDGLAFCHQQKHLRINAFVIMPTHQRATRGDLRSQAWHGQETVPQRGNS